MFGNIIGTLFVVIIAAGFGMLSKPSEADLEKQFYDSSLQELKEKITIKDSDDIWSSVGKLACQVSPEKCTELVLKQADFKIESEDLVAFRRAKVYMNGKAVSECIGIYTKWKCF